MDQEDFYIKEALKYLNQNNSYFKKVYSSSAVNPHTFVISIKGNLYAFVMNIPSPTNNINEFLLQTIKTIDGVDPGRDTFEYSGPPMGLTDVNFIGDPNKIYEKSDRSFLLSAITSIASSAPVDTPETPVDTPETPVDTPETPVDTPPVVEDYYICSISATENAGRDDEKRYTFYTVASKITPVDWKFLFEFFGWTNVRVAVSKKDPDPTKLYRFHKDGAITSKSIPKPDGQRARAYMITFKFIKNEGEEEQTRQFVTEPNFMNKRAVENLIRTKIPSSHFKRLRFAVLETPTAGTLKLYSLSPEIFNSPDGGNLSKDTAWKINARDPSGDEHVIKTVWSKTPIEAYVKKLKDAGFVGITFEITDDPGKITLDDIVLGFKPPVSRFNKVVDKLEKTKDIVERNYVTKRLKSVTDDIGKVVDWWKKL